MRVNKKFYKDVEIEKTLGISNFALLFFPDRR